jgi:glucose/arabinose dehydrogenase
VASASAGAGRRVSVNRRRGNLRLRLGVLLAVAMVSTGTPPAAIPYPLANASSHPVNGTNPHGLVAADVNGDGVRDLVSANAGSNNVSVLLGNGDATFRAPVTFATGTAPKAVVAARLDADASLDLVTPNQDANTVSVLNGRGDGTFATRSDYQACNRPHEVAVGDFDGAGAPDLAVACWGGSVIAVILATGSGTYGAPTMYATGFSPHSVVVTDTNGDGRADLAVANRDSDSVSVLLGRGDGAFGAAVNYAAGSRPHSIRTGDLNGDGRVDLVTANDSSNDVSVFAGRGDGTFAAAGAFATGPVPKGVAIVDINSDGMLDVVTANTAGNYPSGVMNPGGNTISVLLGNGAGGLGAATSYTVGHTPFAVTSADLDGDTTPDLATANFFGNDLSVLRNIAGGFRDRLVFSGLTNPTAVRFAADGRVFVSEKSGLIKVFDGLTDTTPTIFADLNVQVHNYWDRGLLGLELHPNFPATPYMYVLYTHDAAIGGTAPRWGTAGVLSDPCPTPPGPTTDGCVVSGRLSRLTASGNVMTGTERVLIEDWCQQYPSHTVGALAFGADGALYVSGGEGASFTFTDHGQAGSPSNPCGDPPVPVGGTQTTPSAEGGSLRAQDLRTGADPAGLSGTLLRVDPATGAGLATNPLGLSSDPNLRRIVAYGLRNPFRFALRPGTTEIWMGDVGHLAADEVDVADSTALRNFGWPCYEGRERQAGFDAADLSLCESLYSEGSATAPWFEYGPDAHVVPGEACPKGSMTIAGLAFYRGGSYPSKYDGALFFGDFSRGCVWVIPGLDPTRRETAIATAASPVDLQVGPGGDIFYVDFNGGAIRRIVWEEGGIAPPPPPGAPTRYLSELPWGSASNGWGPVERDMSNGESAAGDGRTLTLNGATFAKGLGVHALSEVVVAVPSDCSRLRAEVGVDDEVGSNGSVVFQVFQGTTKLFDSGTMTGSSATQAVDVAVAGGSQVRLVVTGAGNGVDHDHGDWAGARFECASGGGGDTTPPTVTAQVPAAGATGVAVSVSPAATFSEPMDAGSITSSTFTLVRQGGSAPLAATVSYDATARRATLDPSADLLAGTSYTAKVSGGSAGVKDAAGNALASDLTWTFTTASAANTQPTPTISAPTAGTTWAVADVISFSGSATDAEDGTVPASGLSWTLIMHHCPSTCHAHEVQTFAGASGSFAAPDHEYPSHLELRLTATDSAGSSGNASVRLDPKTVNVTFSTQPSGLQLAVGGSSQAAPFQRTLIVGSTVSVSAPSPQTLNGAQHVWERWSDGGARTHDFAVGAVDTTLTAIFGAGTMETRYLSDLAWSSATNAWGPVERDMSNGENLAGDGRTVTLEGVTFQKGLGVHAASDVRFAVPSGCSRFGASVGVDDEVGSRGSVVFRVLLDGVTAYDSGTMTGASATKTVDLDVVGKAELRLVVTNAGDGGDYDHADWADARLSCTAAGSDTTAPTVTDRSPAPGATGVAVSVSPTATFSEALDQSTISTSTFFLVPEGGGAPIGASLAYDSTARTATLDPSAALVAGTTYTATVKGGSSGVKDVAGNTLAADVSWTFTTAAAGTTTRYLSDLTWTAMTNGWGPVERDRSNGESGTGDGRTLTLNGATFAKGLGAHAASDLRYTVPAGCSRLLASVGVDDEVGSNGSVVFQVFVGTTKLYDSGVMSGATAAGSVDVAVSAGTEVRLVITDGGNGIEYDHGDWADARFNC